MKSGQLQVETPALTPETVVKGGWSQGAGEFDLVVWVIDATHPARQADVAALHALRGYFQNAPHLAQPSVVIAVTGIEQLSPAREWNPPYDLARPTGHKAERIREALQAVAETLAQDREAVVPVPLADGEAPYNVDTLWAAITGQLSGATQISLGRALKQTAAPNPLQWARQLYDGGRFIFFRR